VEVGKERDMELDEQTKHARLAQDAAKLDPAEECALAEADISSESLEEPIQRTLVGAAGVHYVAFQLSLRGYAVGLTAPGVEAVDLLATYPKSRKSVAIQVKTSTSAYRENKRRPEESFFTWRAGLKLLQAASERAPHLEGTPDGNERFFVILVSLDKNAHIMSAERGESPTNPRLFIVPLMGLKSLLELYPKEGPPRDCWVGFWKRDAQKYEDHWQHIDKALGR
jgi:hypothetical protein